MSVKICAFKSPKIPVFGQRLNEAGDRFWEISARKWSLGGKKQSLGDQNCRRRSGRIQAETAEKGTKSGRIQAGKAGRGGGLFRLYHVALTLALHEDFHSVSGRQRADALGELHPALCTELKGLLAERLQLYRQLLPLLRQEAGNLSERLLRALQGGGNK